MCMSGGLWRVRVRDVAKVEREWGHGGARYCVYRMWVHPLEDGFSEQPVRAHGYNITVALPVY